jgi:FAD/FMN-containing dehydrogenase
MIGKVNEDVVVPRDRVAELVARVRGIGADHAVPVVNFGHLGDGNLHATFLIDPRLSGDRARGDAAASALFDTVLHMGGALTGEHGVGSTKLAHVERQLGPGTVALMRRIKSSLDPRGLLNPGKKVP